MVNALMFRWHRAFGLARYTPLLAVMKSDEMNWQGNQTGRTLQDIATQLLGHHIIMICFFLS